MSLLLGANLSVGFEVSCLDVRLPVGDVDLLFGCQSSSWEGRSSSWICELLFECQPSCPEDIFLMSLLSGASLPVGFVICCLGVSLPGGENLSVGFVISCLGVRLPLGKTFS